MNIPLPHNHDLGLVVVSIIIAILASYTALDLAGRVTAARGPARFSWLVGGATTMGIGIWSMHFTAMLAFILPITVAYDVPIVIISLLVAILASALAMFIVSRQEMRLLQLVGGGIVMGVAIAGMHYIGMAAMRLQAELTYDPFFFTISIIIAVIASMAALWLAFEFREDNPAAWNWSKVVSAIVMGGAISGMHYTGMRAAIFTPNQALVVDLSRAINIPFLGATSIAVGTFVILGLALFLSLIDQRMASQAVYLAEREEGYNVELQKLNIELERYISNLQVAADVSRATASILNQDELVADVVTRIKNAFNYYHVHLYLIDEANENLKVVGGTGEAGQIMLSKGHQVPMGIGLVGQAATLNKIVLVSNVALNPQWLPNPLLPDTQSEIAVPISLGREVLGVLDVQDNRMNGLGERDANLLQIIANQMAVAVHNSRIFAQLENTLADARAVQERYQMQSWERAKIQSKGGQHHYAHPKASAIHEQTIIHAKETALGQTRPAIITLNNADHQNASSGVNKGINDTLGSEIIEDNKAVVSAITLRNQVIGTLQIHPSIKNQNWTQDDLAIVEAVIDQLAQTAENLRLFDETNERASREQAIREITDKLRTASTLERLIDIATEELGQRLAATHAKLELGVEGSLPPSGNGDGTKAG